ncbi:alpha-L-rhamnosidase [Metarhizium acridum CQMa 102]|uniref:alpha-L-rhamnosidase n=1 Tax=Metarhizium acridum (strain CQMa 102) TaxID=655827 RepID=E9DU82_METAQ|nr:alpha-L-rhamnosidase [Metarhizium acridum CQMa 102]EFY92942.1 alpha-L-rhamnosidase [Metarhizium acridum CQMa 102]
MTKLRANISAALGDEATADECNKRTQTTHVLALHLDLYTDDKQRSAAAATLRDLVAKTKYKPLFVAVSGRQSCTTTWERWDSLPADGHVNPGQMTSFNHYSFGAVVDWIFGTIGGEAPAEPGWKTIAVESIPGYSVRRLVKVGSGYHKFEQGLRIMVPGNVAQVLVLTCAYLRATQS